MSMLNSAAKALFRNLAAHHPRWLCRLKMIRNHPIENDAKFWRLYAESLRDDATVQSLEDFFNLYQLVQRTQKLEGELAEVGVYRGGTAKLIASLKGDKALHLFDTFTGLPEVRAGLDRHEASDFNDTSLEAVKRYLSGFSGIFFHPGFFPDSAQELARTPIRFCMVHLDVDIYESTKAGLELFYRAMHFVPLGRQLVAFSAKFGNLSTTGCGRGTKCIGPLFYPRMVKGAVILSHDYRNLGCPGVKQAFDEFFANKPEMVIELWKTQCLVVKQ